MIRNIDAVEILRTPNTQVILGQGTFNVLTIEDLYRAISVSAPGCKFGVAFSEASDGRLIRVTGNDSPLRETAAENIKRIACGHCFLVLLDRAFPLQVLPAIKAVPTILTIFGATGNPCHVVVARLPAQSAVIGFADGAEPLRVETEADRSARRDLVRRIGYLES